MGYKLDNTGLCTGGRVRSVCVVWVLHPTPQVGGTADTILSPKECAVHEKLKGRQ